MDWSNYTLQDSEGYELANYKGKSGMFVHAWFGSYGGLGNQVLILHNQTKADYNEPFPDYFKPPFSLWNYQQRICWAFPCLPFDSAFKAVLGTQPEWYQYTLHLYREDRFSEAIHPEELPTVVNKIVERIGTFPGADPGNQMTTSRPIINSNETGTIFDITQPGVIRSIHLEAPIYNGSLDKSLIRVTCDDQVTAELPISMFFSGYPGAKISKAEGIAAGFDGRYLYFYFPMPFWKSMKIELVNNTENPMPLLVRIGWSDTNSYPQDSTGIFKIQYNNNIAVKAGDPSFTNLAVDGSGTLVGCVSRLVGGIESNFTTYTDDSETPVIETTGGEDYFNHSFGMHEGFCTAFSGGLSGKDIGYRFQIIDYVPFLRSLKFTQDHALDFTHDQDGTFLNAVFYYYNPKKYIQLTDTLDVGKDASEAAHGYKMEGTPSKVRLQTDQGTYENDYAVPITDGGRWTDKETSFTVAIDPNNDGVRIRKRINQTAFHQELEVYVDGALAGTWFEQGSNYIENYNRKALLDLITQKYADQGKSIPSWKNGGISAIFRDTNFDIPAQLTQGKKLLHLRFVTKNSLSVKPADAGLTNEYYYWIYCYSKVN
jgi:hypothetical protein